MGAREDFLKALSPLEETARPPLDFALSKLFPDDVAFKRWEDSLWLGLFFAQRLSSPLAERKRVVENSAAGRIQTFLKETLLEKAQGKGAFFSPKSLLQDLPVAMRRTCCVRIDGKAEGTGFLVGPDAILTNWHVVRSVLNAPSRISVAFDYLHEAGIGDTPLTIDAKGIVRSRPARQEFLPSAPADIRPLDYALVGLVSSLPADRGSFDLGTVPELTTGSRVVVIGHPEGKPLVVSFSRSAGLHNLVVPLAYYDADTLNGSSGSLVLLEQDQLKPALLHVGGTTPDDNFGIHLRAIAEDLHGELLEPSLPAVVKEPTLEGFFTGGEAQRAGRLATLLSTLPRDVTLDTSAPVPDQIKALENQWNERLAEAVRIARSVAVPAPRTAVEYKTPTPERETQRSPEPKLDPPPLGPRIAAFLAVMVPFAAIVVWVISHLSTPKQTACALTIDSYSSPKDDDFRCIPPFVKNPEYTDCSLKTSQGTITGHCQGLEPVRQWKSVDANGVTQWSGNFDTGVWEVPFLYGGETVRAVERRSRLIPESRVFSLLSGARVTWAKNEGTTARCGQTSYSFIDKSKGFTLDDGTTALVSSDSAVKFGATQVRKEFVDTDELQRQFDRFAAAVEMCQSPHLTPPKCKSGIWETGCFARPTGLPCFRHRDSSKTVNFDGCDIANHEQAGTQVSMTDEEKAANPGCVSLTQCIVKATPISGNPAVKRLLSGQHFPIGKCLKPRVKEPVKLNTTGNWQVKAACECADGGVTPYLEIALYTVEADVPDDETIKMRFEQIGTKCAR
jgi:V8-like Glu-specific endopeptidase